MSIKIEDQLDRKIVREINQEFKTNFKLKDLMEWSSSEIESRDDEVQYKLSYGLNVSFKKPEITGSK